MSTELQELRDVYIGGVGIHEFGRFDKTFQEIGREAVDGAFADAGIPYSSAEMALCSNVYLPMSAGMQVLEQLGRTGIPVSDLDASCAAGVIGLEFGQFLIGTGGFDVVLAFGVEKMPRGFMDPTNIYPEWMSYMGLTQNPQYWALNARRHMHEHGTTEEQIAKVAVKNHRNSVDNPNAYYTDGMSLSEVMESPLVCDPLRLYELCAPNEGAAAAVLCSRDIVEEYGVDAPVKLRTSTHKTSKFPVSQVASYCTTPTEHPSVHRMTAEQAFEEVGIEANDIDLVEVQDTDAFSEIRAYEELGFCEVGEGGRLIDEGVTARDGALPVNVSGGLISKGEPIGASHLGQVHELVTQLRGEAGPRQVNNPSLGLAHVYGAYGQCGITILEST
jgi:acetyl-CoA acetyltransferase